jgi:hypothetical protein
MRAVWESAERQAEDLCVASCVEYAMNWNTGAASYHLGKLLIRIREAMSKRGYRESLDLV